MVEQVTQVRRFLYGWLVEGAPAPSRVTSLYGFTFDLGLNGRAWRRLEALEHAIEDWAISLGVNTQPVDDAHPNAPWGDNLVRKLMVIRGSGVR